MKSIDALGRDWRFCGGNEAFLYQPIDSISLPLHWGGYWGLCDVNVAFLDVSDAFLKCLDIVQQIGKVFGKGQNFDFSMNFRSKKRSWSSCLELPRLVRKPNSDWKCCISAVRRSSELILGMRPCGRIYLKGRLKRFPAHRCRRKNCDFSDHFL